MSRETGNRFRGVAANIPYYVTIDFELKFGRDRSQMHQVCSFDAGHQQRILVNITSGMFILFY